MGRKSSQEKNNTIDFFKAIACIGVVLIHCRFPGAAGTIVRTAARFAVPFFTMISGFYLMKSEERMLDTGRLKRKIKHMAKLIVCAELFAFIFSGLSAVISGQALYSVLLNYMDAVRWVKLIWDNTPLSYTHFWYLYAMLYCYIAILILKKLKIQFGGGGTTIVLSSALFAVFYVMSAVSNAGLPVDFKFSIGRADNVSALYNLFMFRSMPFFLLGVAMRLYEQRIKDADQFSKKNLVIGMVVGALVSVLERFLFGDIQIFIGTYLLVISVFTYCMKYPGGVNEVLEKVGTSLSMYVYVIHVSVMESVNWLGKLIGIYETSAFQWIRPVVVITISLLCAALAYGFSVRVNKKRKSVIS